MISSGSVGQFARVRLYQSNYTSYFKIVVSQLQIMMSIRMFSFSFQIFIPKKVCDCQAGLQCLFGDFVPRVHVFHRAACDAKVRSPKFPL